MECLKKRKTGRKMITKNNKPLGAPLFHLKTLEDSAMQETNYITPLARWARIMEIIVPIYLFGKSWGVADKKTVDLFRAEFPPFLIDGAEYLKSLVPAGSEALGRFYATYAGAMLGFLVVLILAGFFHLVLNDRKFIDSLRFTSVTLYSRITLSST